jgi:hypothetical protein
VAPWPVMIVLVLAVLATTVAVRAPDRPPRRSVSPRGGPGSPTAVDRVRLR